MFTNDLIELVKKYEGFYSKPYYCPSGVLTIGYGHTKNVKKNDVITKETANELLYNDLLENLRHVLKIGKKFNINQINSLTSFCFNCGSGNLAQLCKNRGVNTIGEKILLYNKSNNIVLIGLEKRRKSEYNLYFKNDTRNDYIQALQTSINLSYFTDLKVDGIIGKNTKKSINKYNLSKGSIGTYVIYIQYLLSLLNYKIEIDGIFGTETYQRIKQFQEKTNIKVDGVVGYETISSLLNCI